MLDLSPPYYSIRVRTGPEHREAVMVFRDHADPALFYALPPSPRLVWRGEEPAFRLLQFRFPAEALAPGQPVGGGMALLEFEAGLPPAALQALAVEVAREAGVPDARVLPARFRRARALTLLAHAGPEGRLMEDRAEERPVSVAPPHRAAVALTLTAEGAALMLRAAEGGGAPVGVMFEFELEGLLPALNARARIDYERCYDRFSAALAAQYYVGRAELGTELQWLVESDAIEIELDHLVDDGQQEERYRRVMALVQARLEQDFFRSALPERAEATPGPLGLLLAGLMGTGEADAGSALFVLKARYEREEERKVLELDLRERVAQTFHHVCSAHLSEMLGASGPRVESLELGTDFFRRFEIQVLRAFDPGAAPGFLRATVDLQWRGGTHSFVIDHDETSAVQRLSVPLAAGGDRRYQWRVRFDFDPSDGVGPTAFEAGPIESDRPVLPIELSSALAFGRLQIVAEPFTEAVERHEVRVWLAGAEGEPPLAERAYLLERDTPVAALAHRRPAGAPPPRATAQVTTWLRSGERHQAEPIELAAALGTLWVRSPFAHRVQLRLLASLDASRVQRVWVSARYEDASGLREREASFEPGGSEEARFELWSVEPRRPWRYRVVIVGRDGSVDEGPWLQTHEELLVVGGQGASRAPVRVVAVGAWGDALGLLVRLWPEADPADVHAVFLAPTGPPEAVASLPTAADGRLRFGYEVQRVDAAGTTVVRQGNSEMAILVMQPG